MLSGILWSVSPALQCFHNLGLPPCGIGIGTWTRQLQHSVVIAIDIIAIEILEISQTVLYYLNTRH